MDDEIIGVMGCLFLLGAVTLIGIALRGRQRLRELAIRERIAMIERGILPPPELDPGRFDRAMLLAYATQRAASPKSIRYRTMGVMLMGLGFALFLLLAFAGGVPEIAVGVAGGIVVLGVATYVNGTLVHRDVPSPPVDAQKPFSAGVASVPHATEPPDNIAP